MKYLLAAVLAIASSPGVSLAAQDAGAQAVWRDGESRFTFSSQSNETGAYFALVPGCRPASQTIVLHTTFRGRQPTEAPSGLDVRANIGMHVNPNQLRAPTLTFTVNPQSRAPATIDLSLTLRSPTGQMAAGELPDTMIGRLDLADFVRLLTADRVSVNVFGLGECPLTAPELDAWRQFAARILPPR